MSTYASFQGRVFLGKRDIDGLPIEVRSPGNVAELKLSISSFTRRSYSTALISSPPTVPSTWSCRPLPRPLNKSVRIKAAMAPPTNTNNKPLRSRILPIIAITSLE